MALYLIVRIAGQRVALPAEPVESVVEIDAISAVPRVPPHIAGLAALRSRVLTIVDCLRSLDLGGGLGGGTRTAVIVTAGAHQYGLLVDEVQDVVTLAEPPRRVNLSLDAGWARVASGIVEHEGEALLLLCPLALVAGPDACAAA